MWVPHLRCFFGLVFIFDFHHPQLTKISDGRVKIKTKKKCFQVMGIELWWHFGNFTQLIGPTISV